MNLKRLIPLIIMMFILIGSGSTIFPLLNYTQATPGSALAQVKTPEKKRKILYWRAPMDPTEIYNHPGKSRMGMDLIPVYEGEAAPGAGGTITIDPVTVQNMGIRTAAVKRINFSHTIRTVGMVDYNEEKLYAISLKISGWVEKLYVNYTGKAVRKGEPLLEIYSPELVTTEKEYLLALKNRNISSGSGLKSMRHGAQSLLESTRNRLLLWDIPDAVIRKIRRTGKVQKTLILESPADGIVIDKNVVEGLFIKKGQNIYRIADLSTVWVYATIYDYETPWITEEQKAKIELSYLPGKIIVGNISYIYPYLDKKTRSVQVRMVFPNPGLQLKPGMYANVILQGKVLQNALVVPSEAVIRSGKRNIVFVVRGKGKFEPRKIKTGEEGGPENRYVHILSGLLEGEEVVTSAEFLLDSESRLQEAIQKMLKERKEKMKEPTGINNNLPRKKQKMNMRMPTNKKGKEAGQH